MSSNFKMKRFLEIKVAKALIKGGPLYKPVAKCEFLISRSCWLSLIFMQR